MKLDGFIIKNPSKNSKGIIYLGDFPTVEKIPKETIQKLSKKWYFFWFHLYKISLREILHNNLISVFVGWDDIREELRKTRRRDYIFLYGGSETFYRHDLSFYPIKMKKYEYDIIYVSRFSEDKRCEMFFYCVHYLVEHGYPCKAIFLENYYQDETLKKKCIDMMHDMKIEKNIEIKRVLPDEVNGYMNNSKLSLFTSDIEGLCRVVIESLLAERPVLAYKNTEALTQMLFDKRFFNFYESQTKNSIGEAALNILKENNFTNKGARNYILKERRIPFMSLEEWINEVIDAFKIIYEWNNEVFQEKDLVPFNEINKWKNIQIIE